MKIRTTQLTVLPEKASIFSEFATSVSIRDEAAGEYIVVSQEKGEILFDLNEWPFIVEAVGRLIKEIKEHETE
jgi:hypothetical protein